MVSSAIGNASSPNWVSRHRSRMPQEIPMAKNFSSSKRRNGKEPKEEEEEEEEVVEAVEMEMESKYSSRVCLGCKSSKTPLWRSGPKGPKTLCNACGIKYSKRRKRRAGTETSPIPPPRRSMMGCRNSKAFEEELKQRQREKQKRMLVMLMESKRSRKAAMEEAKYEDGREVANAALLLMSLSSGFCVYA